MPSWRSVRMPCSIAVRASTATLVLAEISFLMAGLATSSSCPQPPLVAAVAALRAAGGRLQRGVARGIAMARAPLRHDSLRIEIGPVAVFARQPGQFLVRCAAGAAAAGAQAAHQALAQHTDQRIGEIEGVQAEIE